MTNLTIEIPDQVADALRGLAESQHKSLLQFASDKLISLLNDDDFIHAPSGHSIGSPAAILWAMSQPPHLTSEDGIALEAAIRPSQESVPDKIVFPE